MYSFISECFERSESCRDYLHDKEGSPPVIVVILTSEPFGWVRFAAHKSSKLSNETFEADCHDHRIHSAERACFPVFLPIQAAFSNSPYSECLELLCMDCEKSLLSKTSGVHPSSDILKHRRLIESSMEPKPMRTNDASKEATCFGES